MVEVYESRADEERYQYHEAQSLRVGLLLPSSEKQAGGQKFDKRITETVASFTATGFSVKDEPAKDGNIVEPLNRLAARAG